MRKMKTKTSTETIENKDESITSKELIEFAKRLYDYLKKNNIKQKDFADKIGRSAQFLSNLLKHRDDETISNNDESNPTKPSFEFLTKLHEVTGVSMDYWFGYSDNDQATKNDIPTSYTYKDLFLMLTYLSKIEIKEKNNGLHDYELNNRTKLLHFSSVTNEGGRLDYMSGYPKPTSFIYPSFYLIDDTFMKFYKKWKQMLNLLDNNEMFDEIYNDILDAFYKNCDIEIKPHEINLEEFEDPDSLPY